MPIQAQNSVPVTLAWTPQATFTWSYQGGGARKIDAYVNGTDVVLQVLDAAAGSQGAFQDDTSEEILLRQGFNVREFLTPIIAWRFRVWSGTVLTPSGTVDMVAMA